MNRRDVKKIVNKELPNLLKVVGLTNWDIICDYTKKVKCIAEIYPSHINQSAIMQIDNKKIKNRKVLLGLIVHELLHCIQPDAELLLEQLTDLASVETFNAIKKTIQYLHEISARKMEEMLYDGLHMTPEKIVQAGKRKK